MEQVSVVIPVYGQWEYTKRNVDSLLAYDKNYIEEIIIVDDCSPEPNPYFFEEYKVKVLKNSVNLGYTGTVNNGLKIAKSNIIVLLDSDAFPIGSFIPNLLTMYEADPSVGCIGFSTVDENGKGTGNYQLEPSITGLILGQQLEARFDHLRFWRNKNILPYSCAVSFKKICLQDLNYFDEDNFKVLEADNDISMRIHRSKWKLVFTKDIVICHKGGISYAINHKRVMLFHESRWKLLNKHKLIQYPFISKVLLKIRIMVEIGILKIKMIRKSHSCSLKDKLVGRKKILNRIDTYY